MDANQTSTGALSKEQIEGWGKLMDTAIESQKTRSPEMALEMQAHVAKLEAEQEAKGSPLPKHSHRFAPENLWPEKAAESKRKSSEAETK